MTTLGLAASTKTPGIYLAVILGGTGTSGGIAPKTTLLQGNAITLAISGSSPTLAVAAAVQPVTVPILLASADDAGTYFGRGSEVHGMAIEFFAQYPNGTVYGQSIAESGGSAASVVCTFATSASAAFTVRVYACGLVIDVPVDASTVITATQIATAVATAICAEDTLPFTAQFSAGVLTLTAKHPGPRGNTLFAGFSFISASGIKTPITSSSTPSGSGTTATLSGGTAEGGEYLFSGGTTQDNWTNALTAIAATRYDRIAAACIDATNIGRLSTHLALYASATAQLWQQGIVCLPGTLAASKTISAAINAARLSPVWHYNGPKPAWCAAAQETAARLIGDAVTGASHTGEADDPAANLDGMELATIPAQRAIADQPLATEIEDALNHGLTPLAPSLNRPGFTAITRSITSRHLSNGVPNYAVLDTTNVTVCDDGADFLRAALASNYQGFKLAPDSSDGLPPRAPKVTTPRLIRAFVAGLLKQKEEAAIIVNCDANLPLLTVTSPSAGRVDMEIPYEPIPGLHILGGNVRQLT